MVPWLRQRLASLDDVSLQGMAGKKNVFFDVYKQKRRRIGFLFIGQKHMFVPNAKKIAEVKFFHLICFFWPHFG